MPIVEQLQADREKQLERQKTIEENIGLVHACAHRFQGKGIEYDDLFQAGCMGLVKATDAFDTGRGVRFSTYAVPVILGEMRRLFRDGGTVKVSRSLKELGMKLNRCREQFAREHGREATITELAQQLQVTQEAVVEALGANSPPVSLTSSEDSSELDLPVSSPEELLSDILSLRQMLERLEERDQKLIQFRYFQNMTQVQVAQRLDMTPKADSVSVFSEYDPGTGGTAAGHDSGAGFPQRKENSVVAARSAGIKCLRQQQTHPNHFDILFHCKRRFIRPFKMA